MLNYFLLKPFAAFIPNVKVFAGSHTKASAFWVIPVTLQSSAK